MTLSTTGPAVLIVAWRKGAATHARVVMVGGDVASRLEELAAAAAALIHSELESYDPDSPAEDGAPRIAEREEAFDTDLLGELAAGGSHDTAAASDFENRIICWAVVLGSDTDQTIYVHKNSPVALARKPLIARLFDDTLTKLEEPILTFDGHFDLIITPSELYILNQANFEGLFKDSDAVLARSREWVDRLVDTLDVTQDSAAALEIIVRRNSVVRRKVTSIIRRPYMSRVTMADISAKLEEHGMDADVYMPQGKLAFNEQTATALVRLLNEDLFQGDFSQDAYAASGKQRLS
ncbi:Kiwa anti-phage protein KwaB-like domain-containing protein [Clavibacter michiganensis]|uniref:Kiwa anti-phage protein KwaB-like domain-containing protein n=1 Tax=Clavibacter michiganensis TaxID=28447 RepID=UPI0009BA831C|nr:Kiwa anti-phage protein KwaB-like domain-containing protein [Clavibacter michiganensis]